MYDANIILLKHAKWKFQWKGNAFDGKRINNMIHIQLEQTIMMHCDVNSAQIMIYLMLCEKIWFDDDIFCGKELYYITIKRS